MEEIRPVTFDEIVDSDDMPHSECGGSGCFQWANCSMSVYLARLVAPSPPTPASKKGTFQHKVNETVMYDWLMHKETGSDPDYRVQRMFADFEKQLEQAYEYRDRMWKELFQESITGKCWGLEEVVTFDENVGSFGSVDLWVMYLDDKGKVTLHTNDYKNGVVSVAADSYQNKFYLSSMLREFERAGKQIDSFIGSVYQPNDGTPDPYKEKKFTAKQIQSFAKRLDKALHRIYVEQKPRYKMGDHCTYCKGQVKCEKYQKELALKSDLNLLKVIDEPVKIDISTWTDEKIALIVQHEAEFKELLTSCRKHMMGKAIENPGYMGFKVVEGKGKRGWVSETETLQKLVHDMGIDPLEVGRVKLKGIGDTTKALKKYMTKKDVDAFIEGEVKVGSSPMKLVPMDAPGDPVQGVLDMVPSYGEDD